VPESIACDVPSALETGGRCKASHKVQNILVAFFSVWQLGLVVMQETCKHGRTKAADALSPSLLVTPCRGSGRRLRDWIYGGPVS